MKIQLVSDVHGRFEKVKWDENVDFILAAGDISESSERRFKFLLEAPAPVIFIAGNHSFYRSDITEKMDEMLEFCDKTNGFITFLEKDIAFVDNVRVLGTTLWSDFNNFNPILVDAAEGLMNDYVLINAKKIRLMEEWKKQIEEIDILHQRAKRFAFMKGGIEKILIEKQHKLRQNRLANKFDNILAEDMDMFTSNLSLISKYNEFSFSPAVAYLLNKESVFWLDEALSTPFDGETIVMTHHAPSRVALSFSEYAVSPYAFDMDKYFERKISPFKIGAYTSSLEGLATRHNINTWVHGHFHNKMLYRLGTATVHCNPTGNKTNNEELTGVPTYIIDTDKNKYVKNEALVNNLDNIFYIIECLTDWLKNNINVYSSINMLREVIVFNGLWEEISIPLNNLFSVPAEEIPINVDRNLFINPLQILSLNQDVQYINDYEVKQIMNDSIGILHSLKEMLYPWKRKLI